ncbi:sulfatase-like hydrolase/transferase [Mycobacterium hackensackense]|uniref:sulfatase-like hydrolase/transferase n=1 Tax=Mycobacterium hackensackense TaxID=228909 RepID=UPI002265A6E7|nr:sulfatase-like hydrolase/transferase [Mycobacterium hackensackense]MCV7256489.1 sulfatase-like hydrolase/transferase [Mycobacterium hackensackense]
MRAFDRRRVLIGGAVAAASVSLGSAALTSCSPKPAVPQNSAARPNILVIVVDEMRSPMWFPAQDKLDVLLPNIARIRRAAVFFERHYTAANVCTAARGALVTGLYSHQTGCQLVGASTLSPKFPTWGSMLRELGYQAYWYGKWHLGRVPDRQPDALHAYGFEGGTFPSPDGKPGDGLAHDGQIADQFVSWFHDNAGKTPWCTTVSLVNPHDIMFWPKWEAPVPIPVEFSALPPNWETPDLMHERGKPRAQLNQIQAMQTSAGSMPYAGADVTEQWTQYLSLYLWLQQQVDVQIGKVLDALATRPDVDADTVVLFTADHGEYGGSHGMRAKGSGIYEEGIRIPLYVRDPSKRLTPDPGGSRTQLTSSVDVAPLLLTIATGGGQWRADNRYQHLAGRADMAEICRDGAAPGRHWIAHTTDEVGGNHGGDAAAHVVGVRTADAKAGLYSHWKTGSTQIDPAAEQELEFYDYGSDDGRLEVTDQKRPDPKARELQDLILDSVIPQEINQPLPGYLKAAQDEGIGDLIEMTKKGSTLY